MLIGRHDNDVLAARHLDNESVRKTIIGSRIVILKLIATARTSRTTKDARFPAAFSCARFASIRGTIARRATPIGSSTNHRADGQARVTPQFDGVSRMGKKDPRVDAYIAKSADFAKPILRHLRRLVHSACPNVEETIKWGFPFFIHHGMLCSMAAFKQHCAFGFMRRAKGALGDWRAIGGASDSAMGQFGRLENVSELPSEAILKRLISQAAQLNESGAKAPAAPRSKPKKKLTVAADLRGALKKHKRASAAFEGFSYTNKKEYIEWITEAKRPETRAKRLATTVEWLAEGKKRNWKYE
jgi:uncharacterized protein YdeI (YjbR/CyaY-like superfamily)